MVENPSSNAEDLGLIPAWRTKIPQAAGQLSLCAAIREGPHVTRKSMHATMKTQRSSPPPPPQKNYRQHKNGDIFIGFEDSEVLCP